MHFWCLFGTVIVLSYFHTIFTLPCVCHTQMLEHKMQTDSDRLSVAMRFVDWFTNRGENYEHNMRIIDKHLKDLIVTPSPAVRTNTTTTTNNKHRLGMRDMDSFISEGLDSGGTFGVNIGAMGVESSSSSSNVHSVFMPGNNVIFHPNAEHAR